MAFGDPLKIAIYCVDCNESMDGVKIGEVEYGQFLTCPNCKSRFNLWGLYLNFYENIPLARKIADSISSAVWGDGYTVRGKEKDDLRKIDDYLNDNAFGTLLKDIVFDTIVFGQSFVEKANSTPMLKKIDPVSTEAEVAPERMSGGGGAYSMQIRKLVKYRPNGSVEREIPPSDLIVLVTDRGLSRPTGQSAFGMWLSLWFSLKLAPQALLNTSFMGMKETKELDWLRDYAEDSVITGSGVPKFVLKPEIRGKVPPTAINMLEDMFRHSTKRRRDRLSREIEEEIFPLALGRAYDFDDWPSFEWLA